MVTLIAMMTKTFETRCTTITLSSQFLFAQRVLTANTQLIGAECDGGRRVPCMPLRASLTLYVKTITEYQSTAQARASPCPIHACTCDYHPLPDHSAEKIQPTQVYSFFAWADLMMG